MDDYILITLSLMLVLLHYFKLEKWSMYRGDRTIPIKSTIKSYEKKLEVIELIIDDLLQYAGQDTVIIVEGLKDVRALKRLGVDGHFELATHHSLLNFCEQIARKHNDILILTDWDRRGNILEEKLVRIFKSLDIDPDVELRRKLSSLVKGDIKDVEGLPSYVSKLRRMARRNNYLE